jgi:hypothetical protein
VQGGFFLRKKPLGCQASVKSRIENAVVCNWLNNEGAAIGRALVLSEDTAAIFFSLKR